MMERNWQLVTNRKPIFHELCWEASSKRNHYGVVAQMVERSLSMREVRGSMPRFSKTIFRIRRICFLISDIGKELTTRYKWKTAFHEFCSEANSKLEEYGDVSQTVERSLCMREVRGSMPRISETFLRIRQFWFVFADNGNELTTRYKWKTDISRSLFKASSKLQEYGNVAQMVERSLSMREVRGSMPRISKTFLRIR